MLESTSLMDKKLKLVLASASPRRKELLALMGMPFETRPGHFAEPKMADQEVVDYVSALAAAKAAHVEAFPGELLLAADTIVEMDARILGKPADDDEARQTLCDLRGKAHHVYTALNLHDVSSGETLRTVCKTVVFMREWHNEEQSAYLYKGTYRDKAGGYAIQDDDFHPVERIEGCYANVMGLPLCHLYRLFEQKGLPLPQDLPEACQNHIRTSCDYYPTILQNAEWQGISG